MPQPILLVEDNPFDAELALLELEKTKLHTEIILVRDGEEAIDYLLSKGKFKGRKPGNPALVLLDINLPKIDGVEVLKKIRSTPRLVSIPVIVLSGSEMDTDLARTHSLGITSYLVKPVVMQEFVKVIETNTGLLGQTDLRGAY